MVVRGSQWRAAIWTSRRLTPASSMVVTKVCRNVCGAPQAPHDCAPEARSEVAVTAGIVTEVAVGTAAAVSAVVIALVGAFLAFALLFPALVAAEFVSEQATGRRAHAA